MRDHATRRKSRMPGIAITPHSASRAIPNSRQRSKANSGPPDCARDESRAGSARPAGQAAGKAAKSAPSASAGRKSAGKPSRRSASKSADGPPMTRRTPARSWLAVHWPSGGGARVIIARMESFERREIARNQKTAARSGREGPSTFAELALEKTPRRDSRSRVGGAG